MLKALLTPQRVALIGASRLPGKVGHALLANLIQGGFEGEIFPINPKAESILGLTCHRDLSSVVGGIDLAIVAVPTRKVQAAGQEAIDAGARAVVVITAGFKEKGGRGAALERDLARLCRSAGVDLLGPNCVGLVNAHHHFNATFAPVLPPPGSVSMISQSGALCVALLDWAAQNQMGLGKVVSLGNKAGLTEIEWLQALGSDPATRVIVGYLESIGEGRRFLEVAEQAASSKPVILLKAGHSQAGAKAAASHTGSLAGADLAYGAAFRRSGVIRAEDLETLLDHARAFSMQPLPTGHRLAILTNAGGGGDSGGGRG